MNASASQNSLIRFPPAWSWLVDELIPSWVKSRYSPEEAWKTKPFSDRDAAFFFKGIGELSELFTEERPDEIPDYFRHPKFRSSYLLYFLPLQAAKFTSLFQRHPGALAAALEHGRKSGVLSIGDLGAGPGTASLAFLLWILAQKLTAEELPEIHLHWFDTNAAILKDGQSLVENLAAQFPKLRGGKVKVHAHASPWWEASRSGPSEYSLLFFGNVLNEQNEDKRAQRRAGPEVDASEITLRHLSSVLKKSRGGGALFVEPAFRQSSQHLSRLRNDLLSPEILGSEAPSLWGPCPHTGRCPLSTGRDWCHFSVPVLIPGKWFKSFSKMLGSERQWVKFSYVWFAASDAPAPRFPKNMRLVISDPLNKKGNSSSVLICEPERPGRITVPGDAWRGDLLRV